MRVNNYLDGGPGYSRPRRVFDVAADDSSHLVERLDRWPQVSGAKPLSGVLAGRYRLRTGDYQVQFRVERAAVIVERMGHRDGFYDD